VLATVLRQGDFVVGPGGSTLDGTIGYVAAALELSRQIDDGVLPVPDVVVVALGSAGTAAGLLAGMAGSKPRVPSPAPSLSETRLIGVRVVEPLLMGRQRALLLAWRAALDEKLGLDWSDLAARFTVEPRFLGAGYGYATAAGDRATELARRDGLTLDATYTAKTFAAALELVEKERFERILYWHTLSSAPIEPLLDGAPSLVPELDRLFTEA
jgi:1-aminocyclopropane-1-carboxylate deaminase/D-cysteine desulfhydrase-like pyridoxal-dependent ACC family enzyme